MVVCPGKDPLAKKFAETVAFTQEGDDKDKTHLRAKMALSAAMGLLKAMEEFGLVGMLDALDTYASNAVKPDGYDMDEGDVVLRELTPEECALWETYVKTDHKNNEIIAAAVESIYPSLVATYLARQAATKVGKGMDAYITHTEDGKLALAQSPETQPTASIVGMLVPHACTNCGKCKDNEGANDGVPFNRIMEGEQN